MSYCRFSTNNFTSDGYAYQADQYVVHVAGNRFKWPLIPVISQKITSKVIKLLGIRFHEKKVKYRNMACELLAIVFWFVSTRWNKLNSFCLRITPRESIELLHAGEEFRFNTASDCLLFLYRLQTTGYRVPETALKMLWQETFEIQES